MAQYADITGLNVPSKAAPGDVVSVDITIKNIWTADVQVAAVGVLDSEQRFIDWLQALISPGASKVFSGSFIMPNRGVTINAYSYWYGTDGSWHSGDAMSKNVSLAGAGWVALGELTGLSLVFGAPPVAGWVELGMLSNLSVVALPIAGWVQLGELSNLPITALPISGWIELGSLLSLSLTVPGVTPPPVKPPEGGGFPWVPAALIGGGAAVVVAAVAKKKPEVKR